MPKRPKSYTANTMSRPEHISGSASDFYTSREAFRYAASGRLQFTQNELTRRALFFLHQTSQRRVNSESNLQNNTAPLILDIGCGSGLSSTVIGRPSNRTGKFGSAAERKRKKKKGEEKIPPKTGLNWIGVDISHAMLKQSQASAVNKSGRRGRGIGDVVQGDMAQGIFCFRPRMFDGCVSISALQWLCADTPTNNSSSSSSSASASLNSSSKHSAQKKNLGATETRKIAGSSKDPRALSAASKAQYAMITKRLDCFFRSLHTILKKNAPAIFQFYPESLEDIDLIRQSAQRYGFRGGIVVDYPKNLKSKKIYLVLENAQMHTTSATSGGGLHQQSPVKSSHYQSFQTQQ
eukprot:g3456.t1